jgi:hypothetical protein
VVLIMNVCTPMKDIRRWRNFIFLISGDVSKLFEKLTQLTYITDISKIIRAIHVFEGRSLT